MAQQQVLSRIQDHQSRYVIGIDEVGYGACAGPLVVVGVLADRRWDHLLARDSKKMSPRRREEGYEEFVHRTPKDTAILAVFIASFDPIDVDRLSLWTANNLLTQMVASTLYSVQPAMVVTDGDQKLHCPGIPFQDTCNLTSADALVPAVSAASVVAKTFRDHEMCIYDEAFPEYQWRTNMGYLTPQHFDAVRRHGPCVIHRISYKKIGRCVLDSSLWQSRQNRTETHAWTSFLLR